MRYRCLTLICLFALSVYSSTVSGVEPSPEDLLNGAMNSWRSGDAAGARDQLTEIIANGSEDPRVYYYRGILAEQLGEKGDDDFRAAAKLEAEASAARRVNRALERTQGSLRAKIERFRTDARNALKADPEAARLHAVYRDALTARAERNLTSAIEKFEEITATGDDPRYFYMHGVTLAEMGELEKAREAFAEGLKREQTPGDVELVNQALAGVQGEFRRLIEEETIIDAGDQQITRQKNHRDVQRRAAMTEDELLADANAAGIAAKQRADEQRAAQRLAAANQIMAERLAREKLEEKIGEKPPIPEEPSEPLIAKTDAPEPPPEPPTETPATDTPSERPATSTNPFLGGATSIPAAPSAAVASVTPGPIDMSYLPAATEYLMYVRPADMLNSGFVKPLTDMPEVADQLSQISAQLGFGVSDIDSVTMGMSNLMATMVPVIASASSGAQPDPAALSQQLMGGENAVIVVRTVNDIDISAMLQAANATPGTQGDKTYHLLPNPDPQQPQMAVYEIDAKTFVLASEPGIKAVIQKGAGTPTRDEFAFVSRSSHMVQAFASPLLAGMSAGIPVPEGMPPQVAQLVAAIKGNIAGAAIVFEAGSDLKLNINLNLTDPSAATEANTALTSGLGTVKQMAPLFLGGAPPELQPTLSQAVNSLASSNSQTVVSLTLNVPGSLVQVLKDNPQMLGPVVAAREAAGAVQQRNNLKQIGLAMHNYHDVYNHFPASNGNGETGPGKKTGLSWRVHILPFLEQAELYSRFNLDEPWDSAQNKALIAEMPDVFKVPGVETPGATSVHVFAAPNTPFDPEKPTGMRDFSDGTSNTIMAVVAGPETATPWTQPGGLPFNPANPIQALGTIGETFDTLLSDGAVRSIASIIDLQTLSNLIQHNDGNVIGGF